MKHVEVCFKTHKIPSLKNYNYLWAKSRTIVGQLLKVLTK